MSRELVIDALRDTVVGQKEACRSLEAAYRLAYARAMARADGVRSRDLPRAVPLFIIGPSGSGKTLSLRALADASGIDTVFIDCASLTGAGWTGGDLASRLCPIAERQKNSSEICMVVFDECDKLVKGDDSPSSFSAMSELLTLFDGGRKVIDVNSGAHSLQAEIDLDLLIIAFSGAFTGIEKIVDARCGKNSVGFTDRPAARQPTERLENKIETIDIMKWGFPGELCGRLGSPIVFSRLSKDELVEIVVEQLAPRYSRLMPAGCTFLVSEEASRQLAEQADVNHVGARSLNSEIASYAAAALEAFDSDPKLATIKLTSKQSRLQLKKLEGTRSTRGGAGDSFHMLRKNFLDAAKPSAAKPMVADIFNRAVSRSTFLSVSSADRVDMLCAVFFGRKSSPCSPEWMLLKCCALYVPAYYADGSGAPFATIGSVLSMTALAKRANAEQSKSALDLMMTGSATEDGIEGLSEYIKRTARNKPAQPEAISALSIYRTFKMLTVAEQENAFCKIVDRACEVASNADSLAEFSSRLQDIANGNGPKESGCR